MCTCKKEIPFCFCSRLSQFRGAIYLLPDVEIPLVICTLPLCYWYPTECRWIINFCISLRSLIDEDASVTVTILDMNALALKMFFNSLNCHASKLLEKVRKRGKTCNGAKRGYKVKLVTGARCAKCGKTCDRLQARENMWPPPSVGKHVTGVNYVGWQNWFWFLNFICTTCFRLNSLLLISVRRNR